MWPLKSPPCIVHAETYLSSSLTVSQSAFRKYLTDKGVMTTQSSAGQTPMQAPCNQVEAFDQDGSSPPMIKNIAIDWSSPLKSSPWNQEAIRLLAVDFHMRIKTGTYPTVVYDAKSMSIDALRHLCMQKLSWTHEACQQQVEIDSQPTIEKQQEAILKLSVIRATQLKNNRSIAQRLGICFQYISSDVLSLIP